MLKEKLLQANLDFAGQSAKVTHALQFVIRQLYAEVILQLREQIKRLQAVYSEGLEEIVIGGKLLARNFEMGGGESEDFIQRLFGSWHKQSF